MGFIIELGILKKAYSSMFSFPPTCLEMTTKVDQWHGEPVVLTIDAKRMSSDGIKYFLSKNGVCLAKFVEAKYIAEATLYKHLVSRVFLLQWLLHTIRSQLADIDTDFIHLQHHLCNIL